MQVIADNSAGLVFKNKRDRKTISVDPSTPLGDNSTRTEFDTDEFLQVRPSFSPTMLGPSFSSQMPLVFFSPPLFRALAVSVLARAVLHRQQRRRHCLESRLRHRGGKRLRNRRKCRWCSTIT